MTQVVSGHGLAAQNDAIRRYCDFKGLELKGVYTDSAESGKKPLRCRPQGEEMCRRLEAGEHLVLSKLDRGFRNARDCLNMVHWWQSRGITCHFADIGVDSGTPIGTFFITMLAAFAEWERVRIGERTREALAAAKANGVILSPRGPYGFTRGKGYQKFVPHKEEQAVLNAAMDWISRPGAPPLEEVWRHLLYECRWCEKCQQVVGPDPSDRPGRPRYACPECNRELRRLRNKYGRPWYYARLLRAVKALLLKRQQESG